MQVYADKASKAMHDICSENAMLRERLQASTAHHAADAAACQQLQGQLAKAQEGMMQLKAQHATCEEQLASVTGQLAEVQVQLEATRTGREAQQAQQQELVALREQLAGVQQEKEAAAGLQHQAAAQAALLRSRSVPACPNCQQALRVTLPALTGGTGWVPSACLEAGVGHRQRQRPWLPHFTDPGCQHRHKQHCLCCREVELDSLRRMVKELQGMQRGADTLRAADEVIVLLITQLASIAWLRILRAVWLRPSFPLPLVRCMGPQDYQRGGCVAALALCCPQARKKEHEGELQQVEDGARQLRTALAVSTASQSCLEGQVAALQSELAHARAELNEAVAGRLAASTASSTAELKVTAPTTFPTFMLLTCARHTFCGAYIKDATYSVACVSGLLIHALWSALQAQALQRELAAAAETRRQLHRRLQHDAQQHIKQNASLEAGTCKLREDLTAAQQKVSLFAEQLSAEHEFVW